MDLISGNSMFEKIEVAGKDVVMKEECVCLFYIFESEYWLYCYLKVLLKQ